MAGSAKSVLFIHGLWLHASSWQPWIDKFNAAGYDASAPGWPDDPDTVEAARANPEALADKGIDDVTEHYAGIIRGLDSLPIVIGHSFGGMIAESCSARTSPPRPSASTRHRSRACSRCRFRRCA